MMPGRDEANALRLGITPTVIGNDRSPPPAPPPRLGHQSCPIRWVKIGGPGGEAGREADRRNESNALRLGITPSPRATAPRTAPRRRRSFWCCPCCGSPRPWRPCRADAAAPQPCRICGRGPGAHVPRCQSFPAPAFPPALAGLGLSCARFDTQHPDRPSDGRSARSAAGLRGLRPAGCGCLGTVPVRGRRRHRLARRPAGPRLGRGQSPFGVMLDPIADKALALIALAVLLGQHGLGHLAGGARRRDPDARDHGFGPARVSRRREAAGHPAGKVEDRGAALPR
jgi:hypothetical protein